MFKREDNFKFEQENHSERTADALPLEMCMSLPYDRRHLPVRAIQERNKNSNRQRGQQTYGRTRVQTSRGPGNK